MDSLDGKYIRYGCGECDELHTDEDEAHACCKPDVYMRYLCPECESTHAEENDALDCRDTNPPVRHLPAHVLEAQGQQRLFG